MSAGSLKITTAQSEISPVFDLNEATLIYRALFRLLWGWGGVCVIMVAGCFAGLDAKHKADEIVRQNVGQTLYLMHEAEHEQGPYFIASKDMFARVADIYTQRMIDAPKPLPLLSHFDRYDPSLLLKDFSALVHTQTTNQEEAKELIHQASLAIPKAFVASVFKNEHAGSCQLVTVRLSERNRIDLLDAQKRFRSSSESFAKNPSFELAVTACMDSRLLTSLLLDFQSAVQKEYPKLIEATIGELLSLRDQMQALSKSNTLDKERTEQVWRYSENVQGRLGQLTKMLKRPCLAYSELAIGYQLRH